MKIVFDLILFESDEVGFPRVPKNVPSSVHSIYCEGFEVVILSRENSHPILVDFNPTRSGFGLDLGGPE